MGVRVVVREGESLEKALRRLKKLVWRQPGWWTWGAEEFVPRSSIRRKKEYYRREKARRKPLPVKRDEW